eukprot:gene2027-2349_t
MHNKPHTTASGGIRAWAFGATNSSSDRHLYDFDPKIALTLLTIDYVAPQPYQHKAALVLRIVLRKGHSRSYSDSYKFLRVLLQVVVPHVPLVLLSFIHFMLAYLLARVAQSVPNPPQPELLRVPDGFNITVWQRDLASARSLASASVNGSMVVYIGSAPKKGLGKVYYVIDADGNGTPDLKGAVLTDIDTPNGVAIQGNDLYISGFKNGKGMIWKLGNAHSYALQGTPFGGQLQVVTDRLPGDPGHGRRFLRFDPNGLLIVGGIGAPCNVCNLITDSNGIQHSSVYALNVTSGALTQLAAGVRNSVGLDFHPKTNVLYFTDNGRDKIGDDTPDCELNQLPFTVDYYHNAMARLAGVNATKRPVLPPVTGADGNISNYGFPVCQTQGLGNPYRRDLGPGVPLPDPDLNPNNTVFNCSSPAAYIQPVQAMGPHTAPLGMRFYRLNSTAPSAFPAAYNNTIFIVQRGSWNRALKIGYRVMLLQLEDSPGGTANSSLKLKPTLYKEFAGGWLVNENKTSNYAWGPTRYAAAQPELLKVPAGFRIALWQQDLPGARTLSSVMVNGATIVYVGSTSRQVYYVVDQNSDGTPDFTGSLLSSMEKPTGVVVLGDDLFVSGYQNGKGLVWKIQNAHTYALQNKAYDGTLTVVTDQLPGDAGHGRRVLRFDPNGVLVLGIGAPCNVCQLNTTSNGIQFGSLYALNVTSGQLVQLATGIRNSVGFDFHPQTGHLYFTDNGRDRLGDDAPDCELNSLPFNFNSYRSLVSRPRSGTKFQLAMLVNSKLSNYGFPFCHTQGLGDPYRRTLGSGVPLADPDLNKPNNVAFNCRGE